MAAKKKAAPRKRSAKPKAPAEEPQVKALEPPPLIEAVPDGMLIRKDGDPIVYVMDKGQRRPFADLETFHACCGGGATITMLSHEEIDPIPLGPEITGPADLQ